MRKLKKIRTIQTNSIEAYADCMCNCGCYCSCGCATILFNQNNKTNDAFDSGQSNTLEGTGYSNRG